jgi:uncharacterized protein (DUF1697 family)
MTRSTTAYAAFLRGVSPMNAKSHELVHAYEQAGFEDVATVASSGNVVFRAKGPIRQIEKRAEAATKFAPFVRPIAELEELLARDPFQRFKLPRNAKRIITFLRTRPAHPPKLPVTLGKATIYALEGRELLTAYVVQPSNPVFMALIEKTFGKDVTTRTWDSVARIVAKAPG